MSDRLVLAVDGGNSKTDVALAREDGSVLGLVRGPMSSPHHLGLEGSVGLLAELRAQALTQAGLGGDGAGVADIGQVLLAGLDFPAEEDRLHAALSAKGWTQRLSVGNDTFAVLRAGTERGWGVAVVCGAGINCVGVGPDGRHARFPALGAITGDWGGGYDVGLAAVAAAARSEDGRGPRTTLERAVPAYFGLDTPTALAEAIHGGRIAMRRVIELPPVVFAEAAADGVAAGLVGRQADEVVALAEVALRRLGLLDQPVEVLLGGGLLQRGEGPLFEEIGRRLALVSDQITVRATGGPAIVGAALLAFDELGAGPAAQARLRTELAAAVERANLHTSAGDEPVGITSEVTTDG